MTPRDLQSRAGHGAGTGGVALRRALPPVYAAAAVRAAFPLVVLPVMAARLGAERFGELSLFLVWAGLLSTLVEGGFLTAATRLAVPENDGTRRLLATRVFSARCLLSLPVMALSVAVAWFIAPQAGAAEVLLLAALAGALGWPATWYLQASGQLHRWARVELVVHGLWLATALAVVDSVTGYLLLQCAAALALAMIGWAWLARDLGVARSLWSAAAVRPGLVLGARMLPVSMASVAGSFALPAIASAQMTRADLGLYYMADRLVRMLVSATAPIYELVFPRIVARLHSGDALRYACRWAVAGAACGALLWLALALAVPLLPAARVYDGGQLAAVIVVLGAQLPLVLAWRFIGSWMLGTARYDGAYRGSMIVGGLCVVVGAAWFADRGALALAWLSLAVELIVAALALGGVALSRRAARVRADGPGHR